MKHPTKTSAAARRPMAVIASFLTAVGVLMAAQPAARAEHKIVDTTVLAIDGHPGDIQVDAMRDRAYVSIRDQNQIVEIDLTSGTIAAEHYVPQPIGLSLSWDGAYLYAALYESTGVARIDLSNWTSTTVTLPQLGDSRTYDVAEVAPNVILVTAAPYSSGSARVVRYDFNTATEDTVAGGRVIRAYPRIFVDNSASFAYIGETFSPNSLYKIDLSSENMPIVAEDDHGSVSGTTRIAIAPGGGFLVTSSGQKLRTTDLTQIGAYEYGTPAFNNDGSRVYALGESSIDGMPMSVFDAETTQLIEQWDVACPNNEPNLSLLERVEGSMDLIAASGAAVCIIHGDTARLRPLPAGGRFFDDDGLVHEASIEAIAAAEITAGCNPPYATGFCPGDAVTRGQMAAFLSRALALPGGGKSTFDDDNLSIFESDITRLASAGITRGCNPPENTRFCPDDVVTRGQMAAFLVRALGYEALMSDVFDDDDDSVFESDIDALASAGVTLGCNPPDNTMYCPDKPVSRAEMATFLTRALHLNIRPVAERPPSVAGTDLEIISKAEASRCTGADGELCETSAYNMSGEFFLLTGWFADDWSSLSQSEKNDFSSSRVRLEATFDGIDLRLVEWPLEVVDNVAEKPYSFQFPDWLSDVHTLDVTFIDMTRGYEWTVRVVITMQTGQPGYPAMKTPAPITDRVHRELMAFTER